MADGTVWRFGYGSNMSVANLKQKKNLNVLEHHAGVVRDIKLSFCLEGIHYVDPAFACVLKAPGDEVHGVAFRIPATEAEGLDRQEGGYNVEFVPFKPYEGTSSFEVGLYMPKPGRLNESYTGLPSLRYLRLLREGAASANLSAESGAAGRAAALCDA
ncbi:unnamed protein product [Symbiodinium natans]|uniref:gamma-glutamylcyclotransferase n=1 Tax=Symbiodinium natans TaxID=878477 RepID=A0A812IQZ9_9DINO|nr:unnamed protein product [Symbiodinium natans]